MAGWYLIHLRLLKHYVFIFAETLILQMEYENANIYKLDSDISAKPHKVNDCILNMIDRLFIYHTLKQNKNIWIYFLNVNV
jgi:hypothetical protein